MRARKSIQIVIQRTFLVVILDVNVVADSKLGRSGVVVTRF